ncbi:MAG TPA: hypothetical protein VD948_11545, partial [Rhodothermales bacterium]|nr:hypothetical protein [Rhodothermales bacterium]
MHRLFAPALALLVLVCVPAVAAQERVEGQFTVSPIPDPDRTGRVQLTLIHHGPDYHSTNSQSILLSRLRGLSAQALNATQRQLVQFTVEGEAGTISFEGSARGGRAEGQFSFTGSDRFADEVARRATERPNGRQLLSLAMEDARVRDLDALVSALAERPTTQSLVRQNDLGIVILHRHAGEIAVGPRVEPGHAEG